MSSVYDFEVKTIDGVVKNLSEYRGSVVLIVNTASKCGFTKQYEGLEALYQKLKGRGFVVLGFPCNQFASQEAGDEEEIKKFCSLTYSVTFPMFSKVEVNGQNAHPLFTYLKKQQKGIFGSEMIKWNFTKFLIDKEGHVTDRFPPYKEPRELERDVVSLLDK